MLKKCVACSGAGYVEQDDKQDDIIETASNTLDNAHHEPDVDKPKQKRKGNPNWRKKDVEERTI